MRLLFALGLDLRSLSPPLDLEEIVWIIVYKEL